MTKKIKILLSLIFTLTISFPINAVLGKEMVVENAMKIDKIVSQKMQESDDKIPVWLWLKEPDLSDIYGQIERIMGSEYSFSGTENEWVDWRISLERELIGKFYEVYKDEFIEKYGLNKEDIIIEQTIAPVIITWMSQENVYRLTECEKVTAINYYDIDTIAEPEDIVYTYTSDDALRILQAVVHLRVGHINRMYDVNGDGEITCDDALLALQSAVKLVEIRWPDDHVFPE